MHVGGRLRRAGDSGEERRTVKPDSCCRTRSTGRSGREVPLVDATEGWPRGGKPEEEADWGPFGSRAF